MARRGWGDWLGPIFAGLALAATAGTTPLARKLDLWLGDQAAALAAPPLADAQRGSIVFDIDDRALGDLTPLAGSWPYGRDVWAHVVDYLRADGARGIVLDVLFAEPRAGDEQLSAALDRAPGTVIAAATVPFSLTADSANATSMRGLGWHVPDGAPATAWADVTAPRPELRRAGGIGVVTVSPDEDGVVRRLTLLHRAGNAVLPAMGLAAVARRTGSAEVPSLTWTPTISGGTLHLPLPGGRARPLPVDHSGSIELWYPQNLDTLATLRFDRLARAALTDQPDPQLAALVRDRQVFIGASALMLDHTIQTPRARVPGVGFVRLSASLLEQGHVLRPAAWPWDLVLFALALAVPLGLDASRREAAFRLVAAVPLAWLAVFGLAVALLVTFQQRTALVTPLVAAAGATAALGLQELVRLRRERQRLVSERVAAERATELKTQFLNHVAHELRTPLAAISGFSRLLGQDGAGARERHEYAQVIFRNSAHLLRLVNNLLDDARLASGHTDCERAPASARQILRDVVATIDGLPRGPGVELIAYTGAEVPERLLLDELRVRQIVLNLVANAAKFTERGHIRLDAAWVAGRLTIGVEDTGPGIEVAARERIFEEFEFGSPVAARAGGTGLGLSVSRRLARMMGGELMLAQTTLGQGSRFVLTIPAERVADAPAPGPAPLAALHGAPIAASAADASAFAASAPTGVPVGSDAPDPGIDEARPAAAPSPTADAPDEWTPVILVCDDSPDIRQLLGVVLERAGAEPQMAPTGEDAIAAVARERPDAVLLDLGLPGMSGLAVVETLRAAGYDGPVIAVTGGGEEFTPATLHESGFSDIIHKPTPGSVLVEVVSGHLPAWTPRRSRAGLGR
jgi:signal transduction histidine kinase/CheY-like chemotaxis protein